jgi:4-amino-4-deoxy-L-arabinose transferase-like glycosyltransferase
MIYWVGTISSHIFGGMTAFALRLPNALAAILTVLLTAGVARKWFGETTGFWAGFSLLTFLIFVYEGNSYRPDVTFTLAIAAGMFTYAAGSGHAGSAANGLKRALAFVCFGLAMLAKGPLGLLLPGLVLVVWLGLQKDWRRILELAPLSVIAVLIYGSWFLANAQAMGIENMFGEFYAQNFERFLTSENRGHGQPWYYYLRNFWLDFLPWSWLFPPAAWWLFRSGKWREPRILLAFLWFGIFLAFLSLAATKRQLYLLPVCPAVALLLGVWLAEIGGKADSASGAATGAIAVRVYASALIAVFLAAGGFLLWAAPNLDSLVVGRRLDSQELEVAGTAGSALLTLGAALVISAVAIGAAWRYWGHRATVFSIGVGFIAMYVVILSLVLPEFEPIKSYRPQSAWISAQIGDEPRFGMVDPEGTPRRGGFAYYTGTAIDLLEGYPEAVEYLETYPNTIVMIRNWVFEDEFRNAMPAAPLRQIGEIQVGSHYYFVVAAKPPSVN